MGQGSPLTAAEDLHVSLRLEKRWTVRPSGKVHKSKLREIVLPEADQRQWPHPQVSVVVVTHWCSPCFQRSPKDAGHAQVISTAKYPRSSNIF
jgi:hypothetical protein